MSDFTRRDFIKTGLTAAAAGSAILSAIPRRANAQSSATSTGAQSQPLGANNDIRVAVIGFSTKGNGGGKGLSHIDGFSTAKGSRVVALCDVDPACLADRVAYMKGFNIDVFGTTDFRKILERKDVDAISIATPNHWHAPITIMACQAGKDVYVEKPISHNVWEGRKMVEAAEKYKRIVQAGTQTRSDTGPAQVVDYIKSGKLGKIKYIHALWFKPRQDIGLTEPWYPNYLDYEMFCGTAPYAPLHRNLLHYDWHWSWDTGNGDCANLGNHMTDFARWVAGFPAQPPRILSLGGRFVFKDSAETPNVQLSVYDYPDFPIFLENRGLPRSSDSQAMDVVRGFLQSGIVVQCEEGYYAGYEGGGIYDNNDKRVLQIRGGNGMPNHFQNFIDAVRSRKMEDLNAPIETGQRSTSCCLLANISYRCGQDADGAAIRKAIGDKPEIIERVDSIEKHLAANGVDLAKNPLTLGSWLDFDAKTEKITGIHGAPGDEKAMLAHAQFQLKGVYREPWVIKDEV